MRVALPLVDLAFGSFDCRMDKLSTNFKFVFVWVALKNQTIDRANPLLVTFGVELLDLIGQPRRIFNDEFFNFCRFQILGSRIKNVLFRGDATTSSKSGYIGMYNHNYDMTIKNPCFANFVLTFCIFRVCEYSICCDNLFNMIFQKDILKSL